MSNIICHICKSECNKYSAFVAEAQYVCSSCFYRYYQFCDDCGYLFHKTDLISNYEDYYFCAECISKNMDEDFPRNPSVSDTDRANILSLCRNSGLKSISIQKTDIFKSIRQNVGLTAKNIYFYSISDSSFDFEVTSDIASRVEAFLSVNNIHCKLKYLDGTNKLGISSNLKSNKQITYNLIKELI